MGGKVSSLFQPLHLQSTSISSLPPRFRPEASQRDYRSQLHGCPRVLGRCSLRLWGRRGKGVWRVFVPSPAHCHRLPNSSSRNLSSHHLQPMACSIKSSSKGAKALKFFLIILVFYLPAQPGAMESRRKNWAVFLETLL